MTSPKSCFLIPAWWRGLCLGVMTSAVAMFIQAATAALPPPPADGIRDDTRAFSAEAKKDLAARLRQTAALTGVDLWLNAGTFLEAGQTVRTLARDLRQAWSGHRDAVLVHYDRATNTLGVSLSAGVWERYPSAEIVTLIQRCLVAIHPADPPLEQRLTETMEVLMTRLQRLEQERRVGQQSLSPNDMRLAALVVPGLAAGMLMLALCGWLVRRREGEAAREVWFPRVHVGIRLGAPHGGGVLSVKESAQDG